MAVEDIQCKCNACGWRGLVGNCGRVVDGWLWLACPECHKPLSCSADLPQVPDSDVINPEEIKVVHLLGDAWNAFMLLSIAHSDEINDFRFAIHAAQTIVLARVGQRCIDDKKAYEKHIDDIMKANLGGE